MTCIISFDCGRFQCLTDSICQHLGPLSFHPSWSLLLSSLPFLVGIATATSFGNVAIQIFVLMLLFNYGKKDSGSIAQSLSSGIFLATTLNNLGKRHPTLNTPLIDLNLAIIFIPNMISGLVAGIHFKDYVPPLFMTIFTIFGLGVLVMSTQKKYKQLQTLEQIQMKVNKDIKSSEEILNQNVIMLDDHLIIDYENIFSLIQQSPNKQFYLKHLSDELKNLDLTIEKNKVKVKDYCMRTFDDSKIKKIQSQLLLKREKRSLLLYMASILFIVVINLGILFIKGSNHGNEQRIGCKGDYWSAFYMQFVVNLVFYFYACIDQFKPLQMLKVLIAAFFGGFLLGFIGMGASILLVLTLVKMNLSPGGMQSVGATLPLILSVVTSTGSMIQLITGALDVYKYIQTILFKFNSMIVYGVLGFIGQKYFNPIVNQGLKKQNLIVRFTKYATIFQKFLLVLYVGMQIPGILKTPFIEQLTPHPYCL